MSSKRQRIDAAGGAGQVLNVNANAGATRIADVDDVKVARAKRGLSRKHAEFQGIEKRFESDDEGDTEVGAAEVAQEEKDSDEEDDLMKDPMVKEIMRFKEEKRREKKPQKMALKRIRGEVDEGDQDKEEEEEQGDQGSDLDELDADLGGDDEQEEAQAGKEDIKITPFNLKQERKQGYYNEMGDYVAKKIKDDDEEEHFNDPWLQSLKGSKPVKQQNLSANEETKDEDLEELDVVKQLQALVEHLKQEETVVQALRRLKPKPNQGKPAAKGWKALLAKRRAAKAQGQQQQSKDTGSGSKESTVAASTGFDAVTEAADNLLKNGMTSVYHWKKEDIAARLHRESMRAAQESLRNSAD